MEPIKLMKSTFFNEQEMLKNLSTFISSAKRLSMGDKCQEFEETFSNWQGTTSSIMFNSGSSANLALIQAMINLGRLQKGDKVALSAVTWATNVMPVIQLGLVPVLIDISLSTLNTSSQLLSDAIASHPDLRALFLTNLLGFCDDLESIAAVCKEKNIILMEDNCESLGSIYKGVKLGNYGIASTFSLYVGHHISAIEGGVVCTSDGDLADMLRMVRAHGWSRSLDETRQLALREKHGANAFYNQYTFYELGFNLRPTEITGFLALEQMRFVDEIVAIRENNFKIFQSGMLGKKIIHQLDVEHMDTVSNFAFPVICDSQAQLDRCIRLFDSKWIEIRPLVGGNMSKQPFFKKEKGISCTLDNSEHVHECGFYFPNNPELSKIEIGRILSALDEAFP